MKIKDIEFKNNLILAPMAGVTDVAFRSICIDYGADAGVSEMISAKALKFDNIRTLDMLNTAPNERIKIVQIFGNDPKIMSEICADKNLEKFDIIDINMGCPAPKIVNNGEGSFLMTDINLARDIISSCVSATSKPITVKFRSGFDDDHINAVEFAKMCEDAGASAITIHARTRTQMYCGFADLNVAKNVKNAVTIPVILSGDIVDMESYKKALEFTKCDAVMIGRGALGNPYIFSDLRGENCVKDKYQTICKHIDTLREYYRENFITGHIRKHILWYLKGEKDANKIKLEVSTEPDLEKVKNILKDFFSADKNM